MRNLPGRQRHAGRRGPEPARLRRIALVALATLLGAALQSAAGFGFALVLAPAMLSFLAPDEAVTTLLALGVALNLLVLYSERRPRRVLTREIVLLTAWAVPGLAIGAAILAGSSREALQVAVGILVVLAAAAQVGSWSRRSVGTAHQADPRGRLAAGLTTGILTTATGTSGPPLVLWLERIGASPTELRDSLSAAFLGLNALGALTLLAPGGAGFRIDVATLGLLLALTGLGQLIGRAVFARLDPAGFRSVALVVVLLTGLASIAAGVAG